MIRIIIDSFARVELRDGYFIVAIGMLSVSVRRAAMYALIYRVCRALRRARDSDMLNRVERVMIPPQHG